MSAEAPHVVAYPSRAQAWYAVIVFYVAYTLAFVDRQIMAFLVGPIRADFRITDFQFSLIHGLAFVVFYSTLGIPIARLADRRNRRNIIAAGVALWSVMTSLCGLAGSYWHLFAARLGVGVGEAALSPSAISIIADSFPKERRALPISLYSAGVHGGAGLASIFGGFVVTFALSGGTQSLPLIGALKPWQAALMLVGVPGLFVALLLLTVREPARKERQGAASAVTLHELYSYLSANARVYFTLMVGAAFAALASYGAFGWVPAMYSRRFGWSAAQIGFSFGLITVVCGTGGLVLSGAIAGRMMSAGHRAAYTKLMIVSMAGAIPSAALLVAVNDPYWTLGCLALLVFFMSAPIGLVQTALQAITPNEMRAQVIAVYLLAVTLIGTAVGPSAVALMTDHYYRNDAAVGSSIAVVATIAAALSVLLFSLGVRAYERKMEMNHV
jgi:MFS family permease